MSISESAAEKLHSLGDVISPKSNENNNDDCKEDDCGCSIDSIESAIIARSEANDEVGERLSKNIDVEEKAEEDAKNVDDDTDLEELKRKLSASVEAEINSNISVYRKIVSNRLEKTNPSWACGLDENEIISTIDDIIKFSMNVWVDEHLDDYVREVQSNTSKQLNLPLLLVGGSLAYGVLERIAADVIREHGNNAVNWLLENTSISSAELSDAIFVVLRAMVGA